MYKRLFEFYKSSNIDDIEKRCLEHFFECETGKIYNDIIDICTNNNIKKVFDIGCAYGYQSECFIDTNIDYIGIDENTLNFWNRDKYKYIASRYPFEIKTKNDSVAISVLCLTWNCYLHEGNKTLNQQLTQLAKDFDKAILYISKDKVDYVKKHFKHCKNIKDNIYYFYN